MSIFYNKSKAKQEADAKEAAAADLKKAGATKRYDMPQGELADKAMETGNKVHKIIARSVEADERRNGFTVEDMVSIKKIETKIDGQEKEPKYKIRISGRDLITIREEEYEELFYSMLETMEDGQLIHLISEVHQAKHDKAEKKHDHSAQITALVQKLQGVFGSGAKVVPGGMVVDLNKNRA